MFQTNLLEIKDSFPKVSIIILNWNGLSNTVECITSLKKLIYPNYEIIVVDNGSQSDEGAVLSEIFGSYVTVLRNDKNYGFAEGNNIAIRVALQKMSDYVFLLNNDTAVRDCELLTNLVEVAEKDSKIGIVGPRVCNYWNPDVVESGFNKLKRGYDPLGREIRRINRIHWNRKDNNECRESIFVLGSAFMIKRNVIEAVGLLDSVYFCYMEEVDYCVRAWQSGFRVLYNPKVTILHKGGESTASNRGFRAYYQSRNMIIMMGKLLKKNELARFIIWRLLVTVPVSICEHMKNGRREEMKCFLRGTMDGVKMLVGGMR